MTSHSSAKFTTFSLDLVTTYGAGDNSKARLDAVMLHTAHQKHSRSSLILEPLAALTPSSLIIQLNSKGGLTND